MHLRFEPLSPQRWHDLEALFGSHGACGGCWCMWWRLTHREFESSKGEPNRRALKALVEAGEVPGILAYDGDRPVAWCSLGPRDEFPRLGRSRILKPVDDLPVWSVVCFYVEKGYRNRGLSRSLLEAAKKHVAQRGGELLEGYPVEPRKQRIPPPFAYTGLAAAFSAAGFVECARRSPTRPIMRHRLPLPPKAGSTD